MTVGLPFGMAVGLLFGDVTVGLLFGVAVGPLLNESYRRWRSWPWIFADGAELRLVARYVVA
jgi:hypothetical protein